ncbi:hypothetical protein [Embleya sp. NBC_00896]|uniref:Rv0361 family membrane protein n=1 Tax=Embleya sp. NBC_00896 TaxID=2975961 RepID=UPI003863EA44|nr:hypothetical protein OG928_00155 [Embleya sp. NBC_00896]
MRHRRHARRRLFGITAAAVVAATVVSGCKLIPGKSSDDAKPKITTTITDFAKAVDLGDVPTMTSLLCPEEAESLADNENIPATESGASGAPAAPGATPIAIEVSSIRVDGDKATAVVKRPQLPPATVELVRLDGKWKLCMPRNTAGVPQPGSPSPPSPSSS